MHTTWCHNHHQSPLVMITFLAKNFGVTMTMRAPITQICIRIDAGVSVIVQPVTEEQPAWPAQKISNKISSLHFVLAKKGPHKVYKLHHLDTHQ
jgi:hypothetical protein